jgi:hypothetical protein
VKDGFYRKFTTLFEEYPEAGAGFCNYSLIDHFSVTIKTEMGLKDCSEGYINDALYVLGVKHPCQYVTTVVRRYVYEDLGAFYGVFYGEDWEMWTRIAKKYRFVFFPETLAEYRRTFGSITLPKVETGQNAFDIANTIKRVEEMLPPSLKKEMIKNKKWCASTCMSKSWTMYRQGRPLMEVIPLYWLAIQMNPKNIGTYFLILKRIYFYLMRPIKKSNSNIFENNKKYYAIEQNKEST